MFDDIDYGLDQIDTQINGLVQRGRLVAFDDLTALGTVTVYLRRGQMATLPGVQALGDPEVVEGWIGFDVLLLCPTGRVADGAYILGPAFVPGLLYDGLSLPRDNTTTARDEGGMPPVRIDGWTVDFAAPAGGALAITSIEVVGNEGADVVPIVEVTDRQGDIVDYAPRTAEPAPRGDIPLGFYTSGDFPVVRLYPVGDRFTVLPSQEITLTQRAVASQQSGPASHFHNSFGGAAIGTQVGTWNSYTSTTPLADPRIVPESGVWPVCRIRGRVSVALD